MQAITLKEFNVAGVSFRPANIIDALESGQEIRLVAEPTNQFDRFAIKIEAHTGSDRIDQDDPANPWAFIGYVPKKDTWIFHIARQAWIKLSHQLFVNHDATDNDKLLVESKFQGDPEASFL